MSKTRYAVSVLLLVAISSRAAQAQTFRSDAVNALFQQPTRGLAGGRVRLAQFDPYALPSTTAPPPPIPGVTLGNPYYPATPAAPAVPPQPPGSLPQVPWIPPPQDSAALAPPPGATAPLAPSSALPGQPAIWRFEPYGEFLYFRPRNATVPYGIPTQGPVPLGGNPIQDGPTGAVDPQYSPGIRLGFDVKLTEKSRLGAAYTYFSSNTTNSLSVDAPNFIRPLVILPSTLNEAGIRQANADFDITYNFVDVDFQAILFAGQQTLVETLIGVRYANLGQTFNAAFDGIVSQNVVATVDFEGAGLRIGITGERRALGSGLFVYGRAEASFMGGEFKDSFQQTDAAGAIVANNQYVSGRIVSILDLELGLGWISQTGRFRLSGGYQMSGWFNSVIMEDYVQAVVQSRFTELSDTLTFDGLVARVEARF